MKLIEQLQRLDRLDSLIRRKATGTPEQLAAKLDCSERTIYNLMYGLRYFDAEIDYCKKGAATFMCSLLLSVLVSGRALKFRYD